MKKFFQRLGIIAASGLVFGALAGASFTGVKSGVEYVTESVAEHLDGQSTTAKKGDTNSTDDTSGTTKVQLGSSQSVNVSVNEDSQIYNVADLAEEVMPSIVSITSTTIYQNPYYYFYGGSAEKEVTGCGSGVIVGEDDERLLIATNNHVV